MLFRSHYIALQVYKVAVVYHQHSYLTKQRLLIYKPDSSIYLTSEDDAAMHTEHWYPRHDVLLHGSSDGLRGGGNTGPHALHILGQPLANSRTAP